MENLDGSVAMVTGSGGEHGFGRAIARRLDDEGADLLLTDVVPTGGSTASVAADPPAARPAAPSKVAVPLRKVRRLTAVRVGVSGSGMSLSRAR